MTCKDLLNQYRFNQFALTAHLADVSDEDSMQKPASGNCINYILGHLIAYRGRVLIITGAQPGWLEMLQGPYERGDNSFPQGALPLAELKELLKASLEDLNSAMAAFEPRLSDRYPERMPHIEQGTWSDRLASSVCHEAYHIGQIALLRRALGKKNLF